MGYTALERGSRHLSPEQLVRMDSDFCTRVKIAFRTGRESVNAATATYDLPSRRRSP